MWNVSRDFNQTYLQESNVLGIKGLKEEDGPKEGFVSLLRKCFLAAFKSGKEIEADGSKKVSGKLVPDPKSSVDGDVPVATWIVLRQPNKTNGSEETQSAVMERQRSEVFNERWKRSIMPFV